MSTAYFTHPDCRAHDPGRGHPEKPERLDAIASRLSASGLDTKVQHHEAPLVSLEALERAHTALFVTTLKETLEGVQASGTSRRVDPDTVASAATWNAARRAAGAVVAATDLVIDGKADNAFCAVRPPGHHATREQAMGFCFFNNIAVGMYHALDVRKLERVAVVDFDVHHGNGTEHIVANDDRVLMCSFFQHPLYPGNGTEPLGRNMVNVPVPPYTDGKEIRDVIEALWMPRLEAFKPQMIFVSAGFDAHRDDDLGQLGLVEADYEWITLRLKDVAERHAQGRIVSALEGGYNLPALGRSVASHLKVLAGA